LAPAQAGGRRAGGRPCAGRGTTHPPLALCPLPAARPWPRHQSESCQPPVPWCGSGAVLPRHSHLELSPILIAKQPLLLGADKQYPACSLKGLSPRPAHATRASRLARPLRLPLERVVDVPGWVALDLSDSPDSGDRVAPSGAYPSVYLYPCAPLEGSVCELAAEHLLVELADARLWDLVHERELVGQPPPRNAPAEVLDQLLGGRAGPVAHHAAAQGTLVPTGVRLGGHCRLDHVGVGHHLVLQHDR